jgi:hypothetical protein
MIDYAEVLRDRARAAEPVGEPRSDYLSAQNRRSLATYRQRRIAHDLGVNMIPRRETFIDKLRRLLP